jgi:hypothetical protein
VIIIALYFAVLWGSEAVRVFASSAYGLDEYGRGREVFSIGGALGLHGYGLFRVAAFLGAFKLVGAIAFALHLADRARAFMDKRAPEHEMLEAAVLLVVLSALLASLPAVIQNDAALLRGYGLDLLLAGAAAMLNLHERRALATAAARPAAAAALARAMEEARAAMPQHVTNLMRLWPAPDVMRRIGAVRAALDAFVRRRMRDFRAIRSGEAQRSA